MLVPQILYANKVLVRVRSGTIMVTQETDPEKRVYANAKLMQNVKQEYPETKGMTYSGLVEWALRKLLTLKENKQ